jgi:hypothetical protein
MISMFKYLFTTLFLLMSAAQAQENPDKEKDIFYKMGGGLRLRQFYMQNATSGYLPFEEDFVDTNHRAQLDIQLNKGEYLETYFRAIHHSEWGNESAATNDQFILQQAWGNWKVSDFLNLKFGRQPIVIGRGLVFGENEWENVPTYYDGFGVLFDWDAMELSLYGVKVYELDRVTNTSIASDPELTNYILDVSFKELSDMIRMADIHFVQVLGDLGQVPSTGEVLRKQRVQRFGFDLIFGGVYYEVSASANYVTGTKEGVTPTDKVKQLMLDTEAKFLMPDWENFQFWVGYHQDSGDETPNDGTDSQYEPMNYNLHVNAGRLDFFKFGNLTFLRTGASMHFLSDWYVGAEVFWFDKTKAGAANYLARSIMATDFLNGTLQFGNEKTLGTEFDLWIGKTYQSGVNLELSFNMLKPGSAMHNAFTGGVPSQIFALNDTIFSVILDVGFFF